MASHRDEPDGDTRMERADRGPEQLKLQPQDCKLQM